MLSNSEADKISKFLSLVLRHQPEVLGIELDENGWTDTATLLRQFTRQQRPLTMDELRHVVDTNSKKRFAFNDDFSRIRASQGHSVEVELGYQPVPPPALLYHGTTARFLSGIQAEGLRKGSRHHVHLSADAETAQQVGSRHGRPVILHIRAADMAAAGHRFYQSANGVWLAEDVPVAFIDFPAAGAAG
ncbi:RNA 2'-phosphotransferase [Hymenobacter sp. ASUV-10]|uniref:Probable RNA 2'-phosphotransferase n=1 Tax=Hymenobacter aranciens TaxID=3063996 RepID=A0ABT9BAM1_9BACT|nr:RNA 2'-phosphotransferase [Hymenobacter sp. ASUV-10]MDO7875316.1 RNA 2'-phosphotransferase [Hymenobacter sp. ASUV-10]